MQSAPPSPPLSPDEDAADQQNGWLTLGLYGLGVVLYVIVGLTFMGLINFPPFMLVCLLLTGWAGPMLWRRMRR